MTKLICTSVITAGLFVLAASAQDFNTDVHTVASPQSAQRDKANAAMEAHDYELALKLLQPLAAETPKDAHVLYDLGSAQDALDQNSAAEQSYRAAIADDPSYLDPHVALGLLLARTASGKSARLDAARAELLAATALPAGDKLVKARAYRALARIDQTRRPASARDELLEALKLSPETPEDTLLAAELAEAAGNGAPAAEAAYRRTLAARPNDPAAAAALAHLLVRETRAAEAETLLDTALAAHPNDPALTAQLVSVYQAEGKPAQALPLLQALHADRPQDANVTHLLANLYLQAGDDAHAEPLLAALSLEAPRNTSIADDHARALIHLKRYREAQDLLAPLIAQPALFPTPADLGNAAGDLAFAASQNGEPAVALQALQLRATVLPVSAPVLFLTAICHDQLHHVKLAEQAYQQFLAASNGSNPDQEFEARHRLVALEHMK